MPVSRFMSAQFANPTGLFGRLVMGRLLNRINAQANQLVFETLSPASHERVLEVGFGGGELLFKIAHAVTTGHIDGVEMSDSMLQKLARKVMKSDMQNIALHAGDVESLPFPATHFDCACSVNTIYFWPNLETGLIELARTIKEGGRLVIGFGSASHLRDAGFEERGFSLYEPGEIEDVFCRTGFTTDALNTIERGSRGPFYALRGIRKV